MSLPLLPICIAVIALAGLIVMLWESWRVKGAPFCRIMQHCSNFSIGAAIGLGIVVCVIGFLWDIGVLYASL